MPLITPLPSPTGSNRELLYVIKGGQRSSPTAAYDSLRSSAYDDIDTVDQICAWVGENLGVEDQNRLVQRLAAQPAPFAQDDNPAAKVARILVNSLSQDELNELGREVVKARDAVLDPYSTRAVPARERKRQLNAGSAMDAKRRRIAQDAARWTSALTGAFARPGSKTYDQRERRKIAADAATFKSLSERYPDIARLVIEAPQVDPKAGPHRLATDGKINASLDARFGKVVFA